MIPEVAKQLEAEASEQVSLSSSMADLTAERLLTAWRNRKRRHVVAAPPHLLLVQRSSVEARRPNQSLGFIFFRDLMDGISGRAIRRRFHRSERDSRYLDWRFREPGIVYVRIIWDLAK